MNRFFRRILLSVWLTVIVSVALAFILTRWLPSAETDVANRVLVDAVASDLQGMLTKGEEAPALRIAQRHALSYENLLDIFVIDLARDEDIEGRSLPRVVQQALDRRIDPDGPGETDDDRLILSAIDTPGFLVVGDYKRYPLAQAAGRTSGECGEFGIGAVAAVAKLLSLISLALDGPLFPIASANLNADPALAF